MEKVSKKDKRNYPFDTNQNKLLLTLIFNFTTTKISEVNFINNVSKITDLEKKVIKDLTQIIPMYPKEKDTLEKELMQSFTANWETNTFDEMDYRHQWIMILRWMKRYKMGEVTRRELGNGTNWMLICNNCSMDILNNIQIK